MTQFEVYEFLKLHKGNKFDTLQLSKEFGCARNKVAAKCRRLHKHRLVEREISKNSFVKIAYYWVE